MHPGSSLTYIKRVTKNLLITFAFVKTGVFSMAAFVITLVNEAVNIEHIVIPHNIQITENVRPEIDLGDLSPYLKIVKYITA